MERANELIREEHRGARRPAPRGPSALLDAALRNGDGAGAMVLGSPVRREAQGRRPQLEDHREATEAVDWSALEPRGFYARHGRWVLHWSLLVLALPLALAIALPIAAINLLQFRDPRRILFSQPRVGRHGRVFRIYKFRTMRDAADDEFGSWGSGADKLRVTPFGRLLRNAHLDELPQLLNVLRGEMTFIGPRPEMVEIDAWARLRVPDFHRRLALHPGITGRSQISQGYTGKSAAAYQLKLRGDEAYRRNLSLREDLRILAGTALWMLRGRGWRWRDGLG